MTTENLSFKITLSGTFWDKHPEFSIYVDNTLIERNFITSESNEHQVVEFTKELVEGEHSLKIRLENKEWTDVVKDNSTSDQFTIIKDMLLNIEDIEIDDIAIGMLRYTESKFILDNPQNYQGKEITQLDNCINLGNNGSYILKFNSPFYIWLLEKL